MHNLDMLFPQEPCAALEPPQPHVANGYSASLERRFRALVARAENGCLLPIDPKRQQLAVAPGDTQTLGRAAWLLKHGSLPKAHLRRVCRCKGCVDADHLEEVPAKRGYTPRRTPLTASERAQVLRRHRIEKKRLADIAYEFQVSIQTVQRVVNPR